MSDWVRMFSDERMEQFIERKREAVADFESMARQEQSLLDAAIEELARRKAEGAGA